MSALAAIEDGFAALGYAGRIRHNYAYPDVLSEASLEQTVDLAAFTHLPESYRTAAFGAVYTASADIETVVASRRALGAPVLFSISGQSVKAWRVSPTGKPELLKSCDVESIPSLFSQFKHAWSPESVYRAKFVGTDSSDHQLDFVDVGLFPAIEHEVRVKLDRLLTEVLAALTNECGDQSSSAAFRTTFRLVAAKVLLDRGHKATTGWDVGDIASLLRGVGEFYSTTHPLGIKADADLSYANSAWNILRRGLSFSNISSESVAFVYENTLVTADSRKHFSTHSTPPRLAEYLIDRIKFASIPRESVRIAEPFAGAGTLLVAAMRRLRETLPAAWTDDQRHGFLVDRLAGAELDAFAAEAAVLALILADYPNANGWKIDVVDLFRDGVLKDFTRDASVVLCNPPWEDFSEPDRLLYPGMARLSLSRPIATALTILENKPMALGLVLPVGFLRQSHYSGLRRELSSTYRELETVDLPQGMFSKTGVESCLVIASDIRQESKPSTTRVVTRAVSRNDRDRFLQGADVSLIRTAWIPAGHGGVWAGATRPLWDLLSDYPTLSTYVDVLDRGLKWKVQRDAISDVPFEGSLPGIAKPSKSLHPYLAWNVQHLDTRPGSSGRLTPLQRPWSAPKVLLNSSPISRGAWRIKAAPETTGLLASQSFFAVWPTASMISVDCLAAVLNGPVANAFVREFDTERHITNHVLRRLPMPRLLDASSLRSAVNGYRSLLSRHLSGEEHLDDELSQMLIEIDAIVLHGYDLPPRIERELLETFRGETRPVPHRFAHWYPNSLRASIPLYDLLRGYVSSNLGPWVLDVFRPAPPSEAAAVDDCLL